MSDPDIAIRVAHLGKRYQIGQAQQRHDTLRDLLTDSLKGIARRSRPGPPEENTIWALKDVSFEVKRGEVVGIIGRNGAGKSTLLKILSRITEPTTGRAEIHGRVGSLLEVGTGFHAELTGRENIFLNGAILGMKRAEIARKFDEIVAFAGVEKFIDTPVKHYSSGMYVRLAFAVAAHLEPEILLIDEVLAVGDLQFQEKCLGKMSEVAQLGRTVFFVSHNLGAVQRLCSRSVLLDHGVVCAVNNTPAVVQAYLGLLKGKDFLPNPRLSGGLDLDVRLLTARGNPTLVWPFGEKLVIEVLVSTAEMLRHPAVDVSFYTSTRTRLFTLRSDLYTASPLEISGYWCARFEVDNPGIISSDMVFDVGVREGTGGYRKVINNMGSLSADWETTPKSAQPDWVLYPETRLTWESKN